MMDALVSLASQKARRAAKRGFREWRRLFSSVAEFDEHTRWADLPDGALLFFVEESRESQHSFYDLLMSSHRLGSGYDFETQPFDRLTRLLNAYFFITDQARFECMRRLGWLDTIPRADHSIIDVVMDATTLEYASLMETPAPTPLHPAYAEDLESRGIDRAALVRKYTIEAIQSFRNRVGSNPSAAQCTPGDRTNHRQVLSAAGGSFGGEPARHVNPPRRGQ